MDYLYLFGFFYKAELPFFSLYVEMQPGFEPKILQRTRKAQKTRKSTCNTGSWKCLTALKAHTAEIVLDILKSRKILTRVSTAITSRKF